MSHRIAAGRGAIPSAARAFYNLGDEEDWLPAPPSSGRRLGALVLAGMVLLSAPLFWTLNSLGIAGDIPVAVAHSGSSGPGSGDDDDGDGDGDGDGNDDDQSGPPSLTGSATSHAANTAGTTNDTNVTNQSNGVSATGTATSHAGNGTQGTTNDTNRTRAS